jgi:hypothetical protein
MSEETEAMQQWADNVLASTAHEPAVLIIAFNREAYHCTGYIWGVPGHEPGTRLERHTGDLDDMGLALANAVWAREGCVIVSAWSPGGTRSGDSHHRMPWAGCSRFRPGCSTC